MPTTLHGFWKNYCEEIKKLWIFYSRTFGEWLCRKCHKRIAMISLETNNFAVTKWEQIEKTKMHKLFCWMGHLLFSVFNIFKCRQVSAYTKNNSIFTTFVFSLLNIYFCVLLVDTMIPICQVTWIYGEPKVLKKRFLLQR